MKRSYFIRVYTKQLEDYANRIVDTNFTKYGDMGNQIRHVESQIAHFFENDSSCFQYCFS